MRYVRAVAGGGWRKEKAGTLLDTGFKLPE